MKRIFLMLLVAVPLLAQQKPTTTQNPLDKLHDQAKALFERAGVPFSEDQEKSIALMIEDRRQASEDLFGQLMDFSSGPVQGQQQDRAVAGIKWMHDEFKKRLREYLNEEQRPIWETYEAGDGIKALDDLVKELTGGAAPKQETQFIRIINNSFTAEQGYFNGQAVNTDVIQRAGLGAFHGTVEYRFKDEALNARNPFAGNKPPYQQRQANFNFSGPLIPNRLTINANGSHQVQENANTVHAETLSGPYDLGITNSFTNRNANVNANYQLSNVYSFSVGTNFSTFRSKNQGVGGFTLPERAGSGSERFRNMYFNQTAVISDKTLYRTNFNFWTDLNDNKPANAAVAIDVLGAFNGGGSQGWNEDERHGYYLNNLFSHAGSKFTVRAGFDGGYRKSRTLSQGNFLGTYTFSNLDDYRAGIASTYRVTRGNPLLLNNQFEMSAFGETDVKLSQRLTTMFGVRYDLQSNLGDHNNAAPRLGFAYAVGKSTVVRGGAGVYYDRMWDWITETQKRSDGVRQYDLVINNAVYNPAHPDPFQTDAGTVNMPASVRVTDPNLAAPYQIISSLSLERTFKNNLFLSGRYEFRRGIHQFRTRDLNAPLPGQSTPPDPSRGQVLNFESTALSRQQMFNISFRQRFSIFNVNGNYSHYSQYNDSDWIFNTPANNYDMHSEWGRTGTPIHQVNATVNAKLFMGVFLTGSLNANSGNRYTITTGTDDNFDSNLNDRPPDTPRNSEDGPRFVSYNFNISKAVFFGASAGGSGSSRTNMNVFANMNNAFNRTNFGTPSGVLSSPDTFGKPTSARNAREIEVGLRFQF